MCASKLQGAMSRVKANLWRKRGVFKRKEVSQKHLRRVRDAQEFYKLEYSSHSVQIFMGSDVTKEVYKL